jgi:dTDP-4-amino-4,6-dideoxygalactose transaminase
MVKKSLVKECIVNKDYYQVMVLKEGDEVILPSYTFVSTANAFVLRGAKPVFCEIDPKTMNIDAEKIEALITDKTKAIYPDAKEEMTLADAHNASVNNGYEEKKRKSIGFN